MWCAFEAVGGDVGVFKYVQMGIVPTLPWLLRAFPILQRPHVEEWFANGPHNHNESQRITHRLRKWMDHFAPSSSISTTAGHHALQSPEYQGTFSLWKGALG